MMLLPQMLMICGSGKNVGKTTLSVNLIRKLVSEGHTVVAIKTSSHLHPLDADEEILAQGEAYAIVREKRHNTKDSAQMLAAGAFASYYIQAKKNMLFPCFQQVMEEVPLNSIIICESGSLRDHIQPGVFLFLTGNGQEKNKQYESYADRTLIWQGNGHHTNFHPDEVYLDETGIHLKV